MACIENISVFHVNERPKGEAVATKEDLVWVNGPKSCYQSHGQSNRRFLVTGQGYTNSHKAVRKLTE